MADDLWRTFSHDPRDPANAPLRAADRDRELILVELTEAFGDGRLDHDELEERTVAVQRARTLGELPPLVADLVPQRPPASTNSRWLVGVPHGELERRAEEGWRDERRGAVLFFLASSLLFWGIWALAGGENVAWPAILTALTLLNVGRVVIGRERLVREQLRKLEKRQARQERWPKGLR